MGFKQEVRAALQRLEGKIDTLNTRLETKSQEVVRLEAQNKDLFDRLMSIDFEKYVNTNPDRWTDEKEEELVLSPSADENNIGEILSDEDLGK